MGGTSNRNLKMFQKLCGEKALKNVTVVTTRWDDVQEKDREATERREEELMKTKGLFFEPIIAAGGRFLRHDNTIESARRIIDQLVDNEPMALQIQIEMRDGKKVEETAAGIELRAEMNRLIERHTNEMKDLIEEMEEAIAEKDEELRKELEAEQARMRKDMEKWEAEKKQLEGDLDSVIQAAVVAQEEAERQTGRQRDEYLRKVRGTEKQKGPADRRMSGDGDDISRRLEKPEYSKDTALEAKRHMGHEYSRNVLEEKRKGSMDRMSRDDTGLGLENSKNTVDRNNRALEEERQREYLRKVRAADEKAERERKEREAMDQASRGKDHTNHRLEYSKNMMGGNSRALEVERQIRRQSDESLRRVREAEEKAKRERKEAMDRASRPNDNTSRIFENPESSKNTVDWNNRAIEVKRQMDRQRDEYRRRREAEEKAEREKKEVVDRVSREKEEASRRLKELENAKNTLDLDNRAFQARIQAQIDEARLEKDKVERKHRRLLRNMPRSWFW
jgi:hypothetical protein